MLLLSRSSSSRLLKTCSSFLALSLTQSFSMSSSVTTRDGSGTITVEPRNEGQQSALVVISHGLGDTAEGFVDVAEFLAKEMPYIKFILPTAPTQPVTMNMGMPMPSWYDITGLDERANENCKGLEESQARIQQILETQHETTKLPYSRMVLAGFSQGGALSLFTGMQLSQKLAGIIMLSGYLPAASKFSITDGLQDTPILHCHGAADPMVTLAVAQKTQELLGEKGAKEYSLKPYPGVVHTVSMEELQDVKQWLEKVLPPDDSCKIAVKDPSEMSVKELKAAIRKAGLGQQAVGLMEKQEFVKLLQDYRNDS